MIGTYKSGGVMGSGHSSTLLLTAENSERVGRKITEVANFDFRKETLHSSQMYISILRLNACFLSTNIRIVAKLLVNLRLFDSLSKQLPYVGLILRCFYSTQLVYFSV